MLKHYAILLLIFFILAFKNLPSFADNEKWIEFNSPEVIDLSGNRSSTYLPKRNLIIEPLENGGASIFKKREKDFLKNWKILDDKSEIARNENMVSRAGPMLTIKGVNGKVFQFVDYYRPSSKNTDDGGGSDFRYAGPIGKTNYHKIDVYYSSDSPGIFFLNPLKESILYSHELSTISDDNHWLMVMMDGLNPPFQFAIADLQNAKNQIELVCRVRNRSKVTPSFKGWHTKEFVGFDLVLTVVAIDKHYEVIPVRIQYQQNEWHILTPHPKRLAERIGMSCWHW